MALAGLNCFSTSPVALQWLAAWLCLGSTHWVDFMVFVGKTGAGQKRLDRKSLKAKVPQPLLPSMRCPQLTKTSEDDRKHQGKQSNTSVNQLELEQSHTITPMKHPQVNVFFSVLLLQPISSFFSVSFVFSPGMCNLLSLRRPPTTSKNRCYVPFQRLLRRLRSS